MAALPNVRRARKDGYYDHLQNTLEYTVLCYGGGQPPAPDFGDMTARQRTRAIQNDPDDWTWDQPKRTRNRTGY